MVVVVVLVVVVVVLGHQMANLAPVPGQVVCYRVLLFLVVVVFVVVQWLLEECLVVVAVVRVRYHMKRRMKNQRTRNMMIVSSCVGVVLHRVLQERVWQY